MAVNVRNFTPSISTRGTRQRSSSRHSNAASMLQHDKPFLRTGPTTPSSVAQAGVSVCSPLHSLDEIEDHVAMAIDKVAGGKIGCAYYIARHEILYCMQDIEDNETEIIEMLKFDIEPTVVLVSPRTQDSENSGLQRRAPSLFNSDDVHRPSPWKVIVRPVSDFKYENALKKLVSLNTLAPADGIRFLVPGEGADYNEDREIDEFGLVEQQGRYLNIAGSLELDNKVSVGCAGAVIGYLQRKRATEYLQHDPEANMAYRIIRIEMFTLKDTMLLSADTLSSLQIIQSETHPNVGNQGPDTSGSKESLSVFGLFHRFARTPQGKAKLRHMFLRPTLSKGTISSRLDFISIMLRPENQSLPGLLSKSLSRIKNMRTIITSLRKGVERGGQNFETIRSGVWAALLEFCYHGIDIGDVLREVVGSQHHEIFATADNVLDKTLLQCLGKSVHEVVDLDESLEQRRTVVKRGINADLDRVKDAYERMEELLATIATETTNEMPTYINRRLNVIFLPQLGFHVTVPLDEATNQPVWTGDETWERRFRTEKYQYFKNQKMRDMDEQWGDLHAVICDTEIEISHELAQKVLEREQWLIEASMFCGELDSLLALTHGALQYKLNRPKVVDENIMDIKGGRHILQEMTVSAYIANDAYLVGGDEYENPSSGPSMILLTGPNYSGKSAYKKQVALIAYLCQVGSFVPAEAATLGITDKILTRINTAESVSKVQSAFMVDLQQMAFALKSCTSRSLVVIDEFGKGTDSCDGAGLAFSVFRYLLELKSEAPKVLASTHFHEIFEGAHFDEYENLAFAHMEVRVTDSKDVATISGTNQVTYLYNLREGRSKLSYGNQCAMMNGVPRRIIDRAVVLSDSMLQGEDLVANCTAVTQAELEELEDAETSCRLFLGIDLEDETLWDRDTLVSCWDTERPDISMDVMPV